MRLTGFHRVISALLLLCMLLSFALIPNTIPLRISAIGEYTGSNPPFRPAEPGEKGFDGEIELNINLKLRPELPGF